MLAWVAVSICTRHACIGHGMTGTHARLLSGCGSVSSVSPIRSTTRRQSRVLPEETGNEMDRLNVSPPRATASSLTASVNDWSLICSDYCAVWADATE